MQFKFIKKYIGNIGIYIFFKFYKIPPESELRLIKIFVLSRKECKEWPLIIQAFLQVCFPKTQIKYNF